MEDSCNIKSVYAVISTQFFLSCEYNVKFISNWLSGKITFQINMESLC